MNVYHLPADTTIYNGMMGRWTGLSRYAPAGLYTKAVSFHKAVANLRYRVARLLGIPMYMVDIDPKDIEAE